MTLKFEQDLEDANRWLVKDENDVFIGGIDRIRGGYLSTHVVHGKPLSPVRPGPYNTFDEAFAAFAILTE